MICSQNLLLVKKFSTFNHEIGPLELFKDDFADSDEFDDFDDFTNT